MNAEIERIRQHYYGAQQSWRRGFDTGSSMGLAVGFVLGIAVGAAIHFMLS